MSPRKRQSTAPPGELPPALIERLSDILGADGVQAWTETRPGVVAGRANTLRADADTVRASLGAAGLDVSPVPWLAEAFTVPIEQRARLTDAAPVNDGRAYVQNLSSMLPAVCLAPEPGMEVLDLAAAPGSKTLQMAARMGDRGRLAAVEPSRARFHKLKANCRRAGAGCVRFYQKDGTVVGRLTPERFDRVLVDAPCSSEARIRPEEPATAADWSEKKIRRLAGLQKRLLLSGLQALKPGGMLIYATCTFAPEENEAVVDSVLGHCAGAVELLAPTLPIGNVMGGLGAWRGATFDPRVQGTTRVLPSAAMEPFYLAHMRKIRSLPAAG